MIELSVGCCSMYSVASNALLFLSSNECLISLRLQSLCLKMGRRLNSALNAHARDLRTLVLVYLEAAGFTPNSYCRGLALNVHLLQF